MRCLKQKCAMMCDTLLWRTCCFHLVHKIHLLWAIFSFSITTSTCTYNVFIKYILMIYVCTDVFMYQCIIVIVHIFYTRSIKFFYFNANIVAEKMKRKCLVVYILWWTQYLCIKKKLHLYLTSFFIHQFTKYTVEYFVGKSTRNLC